MPMRSSTRTTGTNISTDRLVDAFGAAAAGATAGIGLLAASDGAPAGAVGIAASATGVLTGSAGAGAALAIAACVTARVDG
jgi:hypothetical protein